ncbi:excinulease of nucleotide excision repair, DNA damage recognition component [Desulfosarcina cetonica]|uniref:excinuclease ABC subunit UvrB n=1 Tax=Desulfosarcina cetonica TaxID=90730 RepID=UPI0006D04EC3|nr:excinuclease ABC subunit UvrB [Desulfosarcina cetonica]VTR64943.1 excinulease of nucleotide excision repair, DNA damage recognition component [Desulfosarcina cetonica]
MPAFKLVSDFTPCGDQPQAIDTLSRNILSGTQSQVLLGVTGSGKTFTMANIIARVNRPALVLAPNKTLAAQLFNEFRQIFPQNAVEYFVSYYDYYQPEAYIPTTDTYIQKDSSINEMIDKMRHSATRNVLSRTDVVVVASVSCIYGLGAPEDYLSMRIDLSAGMELPRERLLYQLVSIHYQRNDMDFHRGVFRVRGDRVEIFPAYEEDRGIRVDFFGDEIESIQEFDPLKGTPLATLDRVAIFPASHYVTRKATLERATHTIVQEMKERVEFFRRENRLIEAQRIEERTLFDLEMIQEIGYCNGIENYSRHLTGRLAGQPPPTLLDYFPKDFLIFVDESHIAIPQIQAMYKGDRSRKETLVGYGFRLPSALDNRPLKFDEWSQRIHQIVYVSATPADYEQTAAAGAIVEQIVRPTGLIDPVIHVRGARNQVDDLYQEIRERQQRGERILVTTLTKRMAEDLTEYYTDLGLSVRYLHSDISTMERMDIIRDLRVGKFDALIGINLLREGLDIPEVSLVAILDADKEGFLRSTRSLIQTFGRAARNVNGTVVLYADRLTPSMQKAIEETDRRRAIQAAYNQEHHITPRTIHKTVSDIFDLAYGKPDDRESAQVAEKKADYETMDTVEATVESLEAQMQAAAKELAFEKAAQLRDQIRALKKRLLFEA